MSAIALRPPDVVMRLDRMGASHPTRLSFLRAMMRQAEREAWKVVPAAWEIDDDGFGHAVIRVEMPIRTYSLVAFSTPLADAMRTDRVIAEAWDSSYVLYDGVPDAAEIERLAANVPLQEAGRFSERDLILSRANKSVRLFAHVVDRLAEGRQPDAAQIENVGYLMRTTAVYGNGKFGIADRDRISQRPEFAGPFRAEMLTVWLIRSFTTALAEHMAQRRAPGRAATLDPSLRRQLGVGNSTGLGMAPFLVRHPFLLHRWMLARETALARVRSLPAADRASIDGFFTALAAMQDNIRRWKTDDGEQGAALQRLAADCETIGKSAGGILAAGAQPWDALYRFAEQSLSLEAQEAMVTMILEPHGALVDELAETMAADEAAVYRLDGAMSYGALRDLIETRYGWAKAYDFTVPEADARFWYVSEEKLEPRLGERHGEPGAEREQPLAVARDIRRLAAVLETEPPESPVANLLLAQPQWRHVARRVQLAADNPYTEIRGNLIDATMRPIDLLRSKLAFFGASRFDPRSDRWLRISLFAGAPLPEDIAARKTARVTS